jgi:hypothetical protein
LPIITPAQVRDHYQALQGGGDDVLLSAMIARADGLVAAYCGFPENDAGIHTLEDSTYTLYLEAAPEEPRALRLPLRPVVSVTSANVDPTWGHASSTALVSGDYAVSVRDGTLYATPTGSLQAWSTAYRANKVVVVAGFTTCPPALVAILATAVRDLLAQGRAGDKTGGTSSSGQSFTRSHPAHLLSDSVRAALDGAYVVWRHRVG